MGMGDLPDMYAEAKGPQASGRSLMHMLQVLCNTFIAIVITPVG